MVQDESCKFAQFNYKWRPSTCIPTIIKDFQRPVEKQLETLHAFDLHEDLRYCSTLGPLRGAVKEGVWCACDLLRCSVRTAILLRYLNAPE